MARRLTTITIGFQPVSQSRDCRFDPCVGHFVAYLATLGKVIERCFADLMYCGLRHAIAWRIWTWKWCNVHNHRMQRLTDASGLGFLRNTRTDLSAWYVVRVRSWPHPIYRCSLLTFSTLHYYRQPWVLWHPNNASANGALRRQLVLGFR